MKFALIAIPLACLSLAGCVEDGGYGGGYGGGYSNGPAPVQRAETRTGVITGVRNVQVQSQDQNRVAAGTLLGAAGGAILGNQFGKGGGRTAATIVGAGAGAALGNSISKQGSTNVNYSRAWTVRLDHRMGSITVIQDSSYLRVGDRVRVVGSGNNVQLEQY